MKKVLFYIVLLFGVLFIIVLYSPKYSPNFYYGYNNGYHIASGVNYQNINLGNVSLEKNIVLKPDGLIVSNSVENIAFDYNYDFNNVLSTNNPISNGGVVLGYTNHNYNTNRYNNTNSYDNSALNGNILSLTVNENEKNNSQNNLFYQELPSSKMMRSNGQGIENNNGDEHGNGHGWGRDGNEGNGKGNGGDCNNVPLNDDLFVLLILSTIYIVLKYLKIVK